MTNEKENKIAKELTRNSQIGNTYTWKTIGGECFYGILKEWDSNVAIMQMSNGSEKTVEC